MINSVEGKNFKVTPLFRYIQRQAEAAGLHVHWANAKETLQIFENEESLRLGKRYIGAIQYEGSNKHLKKEPDKVSLRFKRSNLTDYLRANLEKVTTFRRDKNIGPAINTSAESIAFKFHRLEEDEEETIKEIFSVVENHYSAE